MLRPRDGVRSEHTAQRQCAAVVAIAPRMIPGAHERMRSFPATWRKVRAGLGESTEQSQRMAGSRASIRRLEHAGYQEAPRKTTESAGRGRYVRLEKEAG